MCNMQYLQHLKKDIFHYWISLIVPLFEQKITAFLGPQTNPQTSRIPSSFLLQKKKSFSQEKIFNFQCF